MNPTIPTAEQLFFSTRQFAPAELEELERVFFSRLVVQNGTFKTTNHRRMDDLNELVSKHLPADRPLRIMDVAVSSGISTVEWLSSLESGGVECSMVAGDLFVDGFLISQRNGLQVLVDRTGTPLQYDVKGHAIGTPIGRRGRILHPFAVWQLQRTAQRFQTTRTSVPTADLDRALAAQDLKYRPLKLVSTSLRNFARLEVVEDDISAGGRFERSFHVLRAANILNLGYFSPEVLTGMLRNLRSRLQPGGLLVICRTDHSNVNNATLFTLTSSGKLEPVARLNEGSEVEHVVSALPPA
jgi:hypothetical protein